MSREKIAVILAAGFGSRLAGTVEDTSIKPLTPVAGVPLIHRTIESLNRAGYTHIVVILGYENEEIESSVNKAFSDGPRITFAYNQKYHLKNGVSVLAAKPFIDGIFTLTMADHILGDAIVEKAIQHQPPAGGATLLVDYKVDAIFDLPDATKVKSVDDKIENIGKKIDEYNCIDTGVFVCSPALMDILQELYHRNGDVSLSEGIQELADRSLMQTLDIQGGFWQDVDTPEMLEYAEEKILESEKLK